MSVVLTTALVVLSIFHNAARNSQEKTRWFNERAILVLILMICFLISYLSTSLADDSDYQTYYDSLSGDNYAQNITGNYGWFCLCYFGRNILFGGFEYRVFRSLIYTFAIFLTFKAFAKITDKPASVFLMYLLYPGILDLIQVRFFLGTAICAYFFVKYLVKPSGRTYFAFFLACVISFTIHSSCIFYLLFFLLPLMRKTKPTTIIGLAFIVVIILWVVLAFSPELIVNILPSSMRSRAEYYLGGRLTGSKPHLSMFLMTTLYAFEVLLCYGCFKKATGRDKALAKDVLNVFLLLFTTLPLVYISIVFNRIQRPFLFLINALLVDARLKNKEITILNVRLPLKITTFVHMAACFLFYGIIQCWPVFPNFITGVYMS